MIVLKTSATAQTISVIPRRYENVFKMSVRDDSTNVTVEYDVNSATISGNYYTFNNVFSPVLVEGHFYDLELFASYDYWNTNYSLWQNYDVFWQEDAGFKGIIYKDRIFCTDQDIEQFENDYYQLNEGQYTPSTSGNNDYIVTL